MEAEVNYLAVVVSALVGFVVGFPWYGPVFGKSWMELVGMTEEKAKQGNMGKIFGLSFIFQLIMAYCLAMFLGAPEIDAAMGAFYGFLTGFGWIFFVFATSYLYEQKPFKLTLINGGYWTVVFTIMGLILGAWK